MRARGVALLFVGLLVATVAVAQEALPEWGTDPLTVYTVHAFEFVPIKSNTTYDFDSWMKWVTGGYLSLAAGVHVPSGAIVKQFHVAACDEDAGTDFQVRLWQCPSNPFTDPCVAAVVITSTVLSGCNYLSSTGLNLTVQNGQFTYFVEFNNYELTGQQRIDHVEIAYRLQVSEPPPTPTFNDVPTDHMFYPYIEALVASGITAGCGSGNYCPDSPLTRGQMAVFLSKALGLHWAP